MMLRKLFLLVALSLAFTSVMMAQGSTDKATPTATPAPAKKPAVFRPTKDQIKQVQTMLKDKKLYEGEASGTYNDPTRAGIKSFQKDNGLTQTGTLNRATLEKFGVELTDNQKASPVLESSFASNVKSATTKAASGVKSGVTTAAKATGSAISTSADAVKSAASATSDAIKKPAPFRANTDQIKAAQKILRDGKMLTGGDDGKLDDATREGLGKYQDANGVKVTKTLNAATLEKMGITLTEAQKSNVAAQAAYDASKASKN